MGKSDKTGQKSNEKKQYICLSTLRKRGWSDKLIERFYPEPDKYVPNPHYACASDMKLYSLENVERIEKYKRFIAAKAKKTATSESARKTVETKRRKTYDMAEEWVRSTAEDLPDWDEGQLTCEAVDSYEDYHDTCLENVSDDFLHRISMNFVRHNLTDYDDMVEEFRGRVGAKGAHWIMRDGINEAICKKYPWLNYD